MDRYLRWSSRSILIWVWVSIILFVIVEVSAGQDESLQLDKHCACHDNVVAPFVTTHSNITSNYGEWSMKCYTCHTIHHDEQVTSYDDGYVYKGVSTGVTESSLSMNDAVWIIDQYKGYTLIANTSNKYSNFRILANTDDTLTVEGPINLNEVEIGDTFAVIYGKMIRSSITTPYNGTKNVKFFRPEEANSFADGDTTYDGVCKVCHSRTTHFRNDGSGSDQSHINMGTVVGTNCMNCHKHAEGFRGMGGGAHDAHITASYGPKISCSDCHGSQPIPLFADGQNLQNTTVCDKCHSPGGAFDGVNDTNIGAKKNWNGVYNNSEGHALKAGKEKWCAGCHDNVPANVSGEIAANKTGDNITYGYYVTGHGRDTAYARMSWQDTVVNGNPGANQTCDKCHNTTSNHIIAGVNPGSYRLKDGYGNDQSNSNCNNCHPPGATAGANPQFYTNSSEYEASVHGSKNCTECHEVHGSTGAYVAMTRANKQDLCKQCHGNHAGHALGVSFGKSGKTYSLQCTSCHNIHIITGMSSVSNPEKSPVTKLSSITEVWGDEPVEKMSAYAGTGTYRTPINDTLIGSQLPDYPTFCLDCHGVPQTEFGPHGGIDWNNDNHGLVSANEPNGYGTCPNWFGCGQAEGWDLDTCIGGLTCWPVIPRGRGDQIFSRAPYNHEERIAGANFVLSCTDCHVTHESGIGAKLNSTVNGGPGTTNWNTMCNNCHFYYSDWHAGKSCGSASCHVSDRMTNTGTSTLHAISHGTGSGGTRTFNRDLVADMRFENNLKDSGSFQMDGRWYGQYAGGGTGSFVPGKFGQAIQVNGSHQIELGTENANWSTDAGYHGTWVYSEMKYNMSLESWVYPTASSGSENHIFTKHTYPIGYSLLLYSKAGTLRAALSTNVNGGGGADCNGLRGAYSTVPVPLNQWTHVAATFESNLPDRNLNDPSVGRIRIYVDGEDVTTSDLSASQCYAQPGAGENVMFPYSDMRNKDVSQCYLGSWCASALFIDGLPWWNPTKGLIGKMDNAKVWNVAKSQAYYDQLIPPMIRKVEGAVGRNYIIVTFNDGVYTNIDKSGALQASDFTLSDTDNGRSITNVNHVAGEKTANITLSSALDDINDIDVDTIAANSNSIYDSYNNPTGTDPVKVTCDCVTGPIKSATFQLNEPANSANATDESGLLNGTVNNRSTTLGDGLYHGNGIDTYIDFENYDASLQASTLLTIETRIMPTNLEGTGNYIRRIFSKEGSGNYQISVWRNNASFAPYYNAPSGVASIAFWLRPIDSHGGNQWKPVMTNYSNYPIVSDHWYKVKLVWNSSVVGGIPGSIFVDDQGTDGNGAGENWSGYVDATDASQSQLPPVSRLSEGDIIFSADGDFVIGANAGNHGNNVFKGLIDWMSVSTI